MYVSVHAQTLPTTPPMFKKFDPICTQSRSRLDETFTKLLPTPVSVHTLTCFTFSSPCNDGQRLHFCSICIARWFLAARARICKYKVRLVSLSLVNFFTSARKSVPGANTSCKQTVVARTGSSVPVTNFSPVSICDVCDCVNVVSELII